MPKHATKTSAIRWDRHAILAEIKRRHGTLTAFAKLTRTVTASEISAALGSRYPKAEKAIARALGIPAPTLWPDRYGRTPSRGKRRRASQNECGAVDIGGAK